jgi:hypothetical protein
MGAQAKDSAPKRAAGCCTWRGALAAAVGVAAVGGGGLALSSAPESWVLAACVGVPTVLALAGYCRVAYEMRKEDEMEGHGIGMGVEWACLVPLGVSALTLVSFGGVAAARAIFRASQPVITPLLGQFFAAFCGASVLGCCLVCLCTHPSRSGRVG